MASRIQSARRDGPPRKGIAIATPIALPSAAAAVAAPIQSGSSTAKANESQSRPSSNVESAPVAAASQSQPMRSTTPFQAPSSTNTTRPPELRTLNRRTTPTPGASSSKISSAVSSSSAPSRVTRSYATAPLRSTASKPGTPLGMPTLREPSVGPSGRRGSTPAPPLSLMPSRRSSRPANDAETPRSRMPSSSPAPSGPSQSHKSAALMAKSLNAAKRMIPPRGSKPAAPLSAYRLFAKEKRPVIEKEAASASGPLFDVNQSVRKEWNALTASQRAPYEEDAGQRKREYEASMEAWREIYGYGGESDGADDDEHNGAHKSKKRKSSQSKPTPPATSKPAAPMNAYFLFKSDFEQRNRHEENEPDQKSSSGAISSAWHAMSEADRTEYRDRANDARRDYEERLARWRIEQPEEAAADQEYQKLLRAAKNKRPLPVSISDDEEEYRAMVMEHGKGLSTYRIDDQRTSMAEISTKAFNRGRASDKTFELARKLRQSVRERAQIRMRMKKRGVRTEEELFELEGRPKNEQPDRSQLNFKRAPSSAPSVDPDEEEIVTDGNATGTEGEEDAQSDAESLGGASTSTYHTLREKKFSVQTRIVNGRLVLDERSLQQSQNDQAGIYDASTEFIDVNESDRFVNSGTHAKRRARNDRWQKEETQQFLRAVSMWGSDFEMIARMFPMRNRQQIKSKWRNMERTDSTSLDLAFKTRIPVDLSTYGEIAGVDLSGEAPEIQVQLPALVKKAENEDEDLEEHDGEGARDRRRSMSVPEDKPTVEYDENGLEIVDEGDDTEVTQKSAAPLDTAPAGRRSARRTSDAASMAPPSSTAAQGTQAEQEAAAAAAGGSARGKRKSRAGSNAAEHVPRRARSSSTVSHAGTAASNATTAGTAHGGAGAASVASSDRERKQRRLLDEERKQRELARRRPAPSGEEEIVEE